MAYDQRHADASIHMKLSLLGLIGIEADASIPGRQTPQASSGFKLSNIVADVTMPVCDRAV